LTFNIISLQSTKQLSARRGLFSPANWT